MRFSLARNYAELFARIAVLGFWVLTAWFKACFTGWCMADHFLKCC